MPISINLINALLCQPFCSHRTFVKSVQRTVSPKFTHCDGFYEQKGQLFLYVQCGIDLGLGLLSQLRHLSQSR